MSAVFGVATGARLLASHVADRWILLAGCGIGAVLGASILATGRGPGVTDGAYAKGILLAAVLFGPVPFLVYFGLGRALASRRWVLGVVFVLSLVGIVYYTFIAFIVALGYVHCGPDAYECPL